MRYFRLVKTFFYFLGMQNDYLFPAKGQDWDEHHQFKKPHWHKTRIGFGTAWGISKAVHG